MAARAAVLGLGVFQNLAHRLYASEYGKVMITPTDTGDQWVFYAVE